MVSVRVSLNSKSLNLKSKNRFAPELNEKEVIELLENATPGSIKKATKCGMKLLQGKSLKTFILTI